MPWGHHAIVVLLVAAAAAGGARAQSDESGFASPLGDLVHQSDLNEDVPAPHTVIGHAVGERAVRYGPLVEYLEALAAASPLVTLTPYATSHEGRTLYYLTVTSAANHARLAAIRADNDKLADPRGVAAAEAARIAERLPGIAWLAYSIHGDELSSTDAAITVAYALAAGGAPRRAMLDELVIHIDPLQNPDGRERYLAQLQTLAGKVPNPDYQAMQHQGLWSAGRGNHYLFDLNRDWLMLVHPETRGRAAVINRWNPHLVVDSHEMGSLDTYLFDPPREPFNVNLSKENLEWRRRFAADQAEAFDRHGWSYYTRDWYEEWYPGYTNAWANLLGAVGILYEQASVNAAEIRQPSGQTLTYAEAVAHHVASSLANLETLQANRREIVRDFADDRRWAVSDEGPFVETFVLPPSPDRSRRQRLVDILDGQSIEHETSGRQVAATNAVDTWGNRTETMTLPAGTLVVSSRQPRRRLLHAILGFDPHMSDEFLAEERKEIESRRGSRVYDVTAWSLPHAYGLEAYWADEATEAAEADAGAAREQAPAEYGYLIDGRDSDVYRAIVRLLDRGCTVRVASKPFTIGGRPYLPGTVLLRGHENPETLPEILDEIDDGLTVDIRPAPTALSEDGPDLGGRRFHLLEPPRVAIASQWPVATTSFGATWHLLDARLGLRASPVNVQRLGAIDLRKYNVLVLPHVWSAGLLGGTLDERALDRIRDWVRAGGTLIAYGGAAAYLADEGRKLSQVRLRRDALEDLDVYDEAVQRERAARAVEIDSDVVWGRDVPESEAPQESPPSGDDDALQRADEWSRIFSSQGAMARADLDPEHWLSFGLDDRLPVLLSGSYAFLSMHPVATPARLGDADTLRLSGLLWPEARERWAQSAYATVERVGAGQVILFASDPFFRGYFEGSGRLLQNAILLGPGLGASPPVPW